MVSQVADVWGKHARNLISDGVSLQIQLREITTASSMALKSTTSPVLPFASPRRLDVAILRRSAFLKGLGATERNRPLARFFEPDNYNGNKNAKISPIDISVGIPGLLVNKLSYGQKMLWKQLRWLIRPRKVKQTSMMSFLGRISHLNCFHCSFCPYDSLLTRKPGNPTVYIQIYWDVNGVY